MIRVAVSLVLMLLVNSVVINPALAQDAKQQPAKQVAPQVPAPVQPQAGTSLSAGKETTQVSPDCVCIKPAIDAIQKACGSLEEDEWPAAIKTCTDSQNAINNLAKTCMCAEIATYKNIAAAFLNYAKGGNLLDGEDEPDCKIARQLYGDAISLLEDSIPKITTKEVKSCAGNINDYAKEELQFVKDECGESQPAAKQQPQTKSPPK